MSHLYESKGKANESVVIAVRIMGIMWRVLSGREQKRSFWAAGNILHLDLCDDCTGVGICKTSSGGAPKICAFYCMHVMLQYNF